ncbi:MAG: MraY family glycosyltransferase [Eubacteriales bacterium]|nr:MraY family glycosyltransferase [Eubacteriales bacterium]
MINVIPKELLLIVGAALLVAMAISFLMCPLVKSFAYKIGAIDVPKDNRRMHKKPVPRLGGLAIFMGFMVSILLFASIDHEMQGILLGAVIIVVLGVVDDMTPLRAYFKFIVQIVAALVAVFHGVVIETLSNPNIFSQSPYWNLGWIAIPVTVLWIVGITNAVNLIDGLDGLACGVSTISALTMLVIALLVSESGVAVIMASLVGACLGFMPYNRNPAKMFMGDTGSTFLGYILATISIQGLFKYYAIVSFAVPFLILGLPMFDTLFAIIRRLVHGQNPMAPDRGHIHHRLIDMGLNQKQAVAALYVVSSILGLSAVVLTASGAVKAMLLMMTLIIVAYIASRVIFPRGAEEQNGSVPEQTNPAMEATDGESKREEAKNEDNEGVES